MMKNEQTYPDTVAGAHGFLKSSMNAGRYAELYEGMQAYPGQLPGEWLIASRHPNKYENCALVTLAGYGGRARSDFEEGYSRDVADYESVV